MTGFCLVYITTADVEQARLIGRTLVSSRLAACANILDGMESIYWWHDQIQSDREAVLIVKTRESLLTELIDTVRGIHSYDCPCIISIPILAGNADYLDWIATETERE